MGTITTRETRQLPETWWETVCRIAAGSQLSLRPSLGKHGRGRFTIGETIGGFMYLERGMVSGYEVGNLMGNGEILRDDAFRTGSHDDYRIAFRLMAVEMVDLWIQETDRCTEEFLDSRAARGRRQLTGRAFQR